MSGQLERLTAEWNLDIDAAIVSSAPNRLYLTGLSSTAGTLLVTPGESVLFVDFRYIEQARKAARGCSVVLEEDLAGQLNEQIRGRGIRRVGVEDRYLPLRDFHRWQGELAAQVVADSGFQERLDAQRAVKTQAELECLREAQRRTDASFAYLCDFIRPGISELELNLLLGEYMARHGSEERTYDYLMNTGVKTSLPHGRATDKQVQAGDFVMMDIGFVVGGYHSDMTRTVAVGHATEEMAAVYATVLEAQTRAITAVRAGRCCRDIDAVARDYIYGQGYRGKFGHGLGHSVGIEVHENPRFNEVCTDRLLPGTVMTVEPGIYLENRFGVRIEDMVAVTEQGCENLTGAAKELLVL